MSAEKALVKAFDASGYKVGIVCARFNEKITDGLLESALRTLEEEFKVREKDITVARVRGSVEIPLILQTLAKTKKYDCLVALGAVVKGETKHDEYVAQIVTEGVLRVMLDYNIPIGFGIQTTYNQEQALARIDRGGGSAAAALECARLKKELSK